MKDAILDKILSDQESLTEDDIVLNNDSSMMSVNVDRLRLDRKQPARDLFVREAPSSPLAENYERQERDQTDTQEENNVGGENDKDQSDIITTLPRERKRVRFNSRDEQHHNPDEINPWDLKKLVRSELRQRLPENYEIRTWKRPPRTLVRSLVDLMETNVTRAVEKVLSNYETECVRTLGSDQFGKFRADKEQMLYNLIGKLQTRIKRSRFPARIAENALDIEYIFAKRNYIQQQYASQLHSAEAMEERLIQEQRTASEFEEQVANPSSKELLKELTADLHPSLHKAVTNSYGLIKDNQNTRSTYLIDKEDLNLRLDSA
ncbi:HHR036Cp [Eremothecium sinecaudum]|uniref:HHR036Cp n=1 Tax=Eremothecium sinecaudum TaxID=45286 RepID=A0A0X8HWN8_9SACH|nr:HHR036Cp [Eremothecium sinecaudum]AMD22805.1 HHR036Cp [Eremothecium sinecaudum]